MIEFALLGLAAATQPVAPPAPPPVVAIPAPPSPFGPPVSRALSRPIVTYSIRIAAGQERLLDERLRVGVPGATVNRARQEALTADCTAARGTLNSQLYLQLRPDYANIQSNRMQVELRWSRPVQTGCDAGSRTSTIEQFVDLSPGQSTTISGDAGLTVSIRRE